MDAGPEAWEEIGSCNFLQLSLKSELQGLDGGLDGGPRFWIAVASQALTLCCFALFLLLAPIPQSPGRQKEGLPLHVLVLLGLTTGLDFFCTDQYQPSMPKISRQFGVDPEAVGSTIQVHLISSALATLCAGHWIRQRGTRQMILWCQLFLAAGALGCAFAPSFGWFVVGRVLQGISASSSVAVSAMLTASYSDREELRRASNKVACVALLAHIAGPATGGLIAWAFGSYGWQVSFLAVFGLAALNILASYLLLPDARVDEEPAKATPKPQRDGVLRRQLLVLLGLSLLRGSSYVLMSVNGFIFESSFLLGIRPAAVMMSILVASRAFGMLASTTLGFSPVEALNLFSPLLLLAAGYAAVVGAFMISDNPLTYMSGLALHQFLAHGPTWAVLAEAQKDPELDDAGLPPHIYAGIMNVSACMLSLFGLSAISGGPSAVLYVVAIMSATSQACIRAGSLWAAAKQLFRAQQALESTSDSDPAPKPPPDD
ncbi:mdtL [Symbiodinium sp. CCMP2592]|nr:mdtL [Symbiodinium sp. CCMP2592]